MKKLLLSLWFFSSYSLYSLSFDDQLKNTIKVSELSSKLDLKWTGQDHKVCMISPLEQTELGCLTYSNNKKLINHIKFEPNTSTEIGIKNFISWHKTYYD